MRRGLLLVTLLLALVACDSSSQSVTPSSCYPEVPAGATALTIEGTRDLQFDPDQLTAPPGSVHITLENPSSLPHSLVLEDFDFKLATDAGEDCGDSLTLEPGSYPFHCDVPGHQEAGMKGVLVAE